MYSQYLQVLLYYHTTITEDVENVCTTIFSRFIASVNPFFCESYLLSSVAVLDVTQFSHLNY
jgi:hypothetical protein